MIHSIRHQEAFYNRSNANVLHITLKSINKPYKACKPLPNVRNATSSSNGGIIIGEKNLWNLTLLFNNRINCATAKVHLDEQRIKIRNKHMEYIMSALD